MEQWILKMKKNDFYEIAKECEISPFLVRILCNRGIDTKEKVDFFLHATVSDMYNPYLLKDMKKATELLLIDIKERKKIRIIGDYDVDGVTASYILRCMVTTLGGLCDVVIPHRMEDGYGLNRSFIEQAIEQKVDTILTCDNGISAYDEIALARESGINVIVTDHHEVPYVLQGEDRKQVIPPANAVIDPKQCADTYPYEGICGATVAFKLACALFDRAMDEGMLTKEQKKEVLSELLQFAAFGTICDVMELLDENRIIVKYGLMAMKQTKNTGLKALLEVCALMGDITCYQVGFVLGPCVNATGRLDTAKRALELFCETEKQNALLIAQELKDLNEVRKNLTQEGIDQAVRLIESSDLKKDRVLAVYLKDCHESIAGIIAGKIREKYNKPTFVITDAKDGLKGSGRSTDEYHMRDELQKVSFLLTQFGGHKLAAGFSLKKENLEAFRKEVNEKCTLTEEEQRKKVYIDIDLPISYADLSFAKSLDVLEPFGTGNHLPLFAQRKAVLGSYRILGEKRRAVRFSVQADEKSRVNGIFFGEADAFVENMKAHGNVADIVYAVRLHVFRGECSVQLEVKHYRFS